MFATIFMWKATGIAALLSYKEEVLCSKLIPDTTMVLFSFQESLVNNIKV